MAECSRGKAAFAGCADTPQEDGMKTDELKRLLSKLQGDPELRGEFHRLGADCEQMVHLAAAKGYRLTRQEAEELVQSFQELSDEDLDQAAGGAWNDPPPPGGTGG